MTSLLHNEVTNTLADYHQKYQNTMAYTVSNMKSKHLGLWYLKQLDLTCVIYQRVCDLIDNLASCSDAQKQQLKTVLQRLSEIVLPLFVAGMDANPIHHNIQTVENMLLVLSHDGADYKYLRKAAILALLHDVGSGLVDPNLKKVKSSDIKDRQEQLRRENTPEEKIKEETQKLIDDAIKYRKAHMEAGAEVVRKLLKQVNISGNTSLRTNEINEIANCIKKHDNPSIAELFSELGQKIKKRHLIPLGNRLAYVLREADRLWMVSKEGLEKDLFDDLRAGKTADPFAKLRHNVSRFKAEFLLYKNAQGITQSNLAKFQSKTLFRTDGGYYRYRHHVAKRLQELIGECYGDAILDTLSEKYVP